MTNRQAYSIVIGLALAVFFFSYFFFRVPDKPTNENFANEFSLVHQDYSGKDVHLYEFRRQIIVAYAWASWCTYCGAELQELVKLKKTYGDKIQILAINRAEPLLTAKAFTDNLGISEDVTLLLDPRDTFFRSIGGYAMPETVFINEKGDIVFHQRGPIDVVSIETSLKDLVR